MTAPKSKVYEFTGTELTVSWDLKRCIHAEQCVHGMPEVFDPKRRPWIDPDRGEANALRQVVMQCPTGALHYQDRSGEEPEPTPSVNSARVEVDGPLYLEGDLTIQTSAGEEMRENRAALCRCGDSKNKPFCDNTHLETGFVDDGRLGESRLRTSESTAPGLSIVLAPNGPLVLNGPVTLRCTTSADQSGTQCSLCRCGGSLNKPYCDGSHVGLGFTAD